MLPSCVITSVWQTTCTRAVGLLLPWKERQQTFCALGVWAAGAWPGSVSRPRRARARHPVELFYSPKRRLTVRRQKQPLDRTTASPLYRLLAGQPFGFRNADNPEVHVRRPPSACLGLAESLQASGRSPVPVRILPPSSLVTSCYHFRLRTTWLAAQGWVAGAPPASPSSSSLEAPAASRCPAAQSPVRCGSPSVKPRDAPAGGRGAAGLHRCPLSLSAAVSCKQGPSPGSSVRHRSPAAETATALESGYFGHHASFPPRRVSDAKSSP